MGASGEKQEDLRSKKTMLQELRAFVLASPQHSFLTDIHIAKWNDATVLELLGDDLGACVLEHVAEYQEIARSKHQQQHWLYHLAVAGEPPQTVLPLMPSRSSGFPPQ